MTGLVTGLDAVTDLISTLSPAKSPVCVKLTITQL